jgi:L-arabinose isomerase
LRRCGKRFQIVAGHVTRSDCLARAAEVARAAYAARVLSGTRVLRVGESFRGMGDFAVSEKVMKRVLGVTVEQVDAMSLAADVKKVTESEIKAEMARDRQAFKADLSAAVHRRAVRVSLGLRRRLERGGYGAFSMNFLAFNRSDGPVDTVPFLEASKAMARGLGYAGEGDALTAALVGALSAAFGRTTFTEIFCPDWQGDSLFLSHMGEINPQVAAGKPLLCEHDFPYTPAQNPAVLACSPAAGPAVLVNLAPGPHDTFGLIVAPVAVLPEKPNRKMAKAIRGWIRPTDDVATFLENYSRLGGTHHSALVLGEKVAAIAAFGEFAGIEVSVI